MVLVRVGKRVLSHVSGDGRNTGDRKVGDESRGREGLRSGIDGGFGRRERRWKERWKGR